MEAVSNNYDVFKTYLATKGKARFEFLTFFHVQGILVPLPPFLYYFCISQRITHNLSIAIPISSPQGRWNENLLRRTWKPKFSELNISSFLGKKQVQTGLMRGYKRFFWQRRNEIIIWYIHHRWMPYRRQNGWQYICYKIHVRRTICPS